MTKNIEYTIVEKHINHIKIGDTVLHDGIEKTVNKNSFKFDTFMGVTLWGDSYNLGYKKVKVLCK